MPAAELTGVAGVRNARPGQLQPGAGQLISPSAPAGLVGTEAKLIAHLYSNTGTFKQILSILARPKFQYTIESAGQPMLLEMTSLTDAPTGTAPTWGDVVRVTQQTADTTYLYSGIIEDLEIDYGPKTSYALALQPIGTELGDTFFSVGYNSPTDPATMVRDAVAQTKHLYVTPQSCPNTGQLGIYNFSNTTCLEVLHIAKLIAGVTYWWYVGPDGLVWFRPFQSAGAPSYTVKQGSDYIARKFRQPIGKLKNKIVAVGGIPSGGSAPRTSTYSDSTSQDQYGVRAQMPPLNFPTVTDQATLDAVTTTVGSALNRRSVRVELTLTNYPQRVVIGQLSPTIRYWEPATQPMAEGFTGTGGYSANYLVLDVQNDGPTQIVTLGDIPPTSIDDFKYVESQLIHRTSISNLTYVPASLNVVGQINGGGLQTAGPGNARWVIDGASIRGEDGTLTDYGAGPGITSAIKADGSFFGSRVTLQSAAAGARLVLNGSTPELTVYDTGGVPRFDVGNLASGPGGSPSGYGFRVEDSSGNLLMDSQGLAQVMTLVASSTYSVTNAGVGVLSGSTTGTFTISRPGNFLVLGAGYCNLNPLSFGAAFTTFSASLLYGRVNSTQATPAVAATNRVQGNYSLISNSVVSLAAGSYTADVYTPVGSCDATGNLNIFQIGS